MIAMRPPVHTPETRLADGDVGYGMRRLDDCLRAAIATTLQVPIDEVPDQHLVTRARRASPRDVGRSAWAELQRWLNDQGLRMIVHRKVPARRRRWIGVVPCGGVFNDHCLVMCHGELHFDPASSIVPPAGMRRLGWQPSEIAYGLSFERKACQ